MTEWSTFGDVDRFRNAVHVRDLGRGTFKRVAVVSLPGPSGGSFAKAQYRPQEQRVATRFSARDRFRREVRAMRALSTSHVMPVLCADLGDDPPWFIMPLADCDFGQMPAKVSARPEAAEAFRQVLDGVAAMHLAGFVHRDIKPNNVLGVDGRWVVSDLGLLRDERPSTITLQDINLAGAHRAPEVRESLRDATAASDVYSLGWLVQTLVPGIERKVTGRPSPFRTLENARALQAVVSRCLQDEPALRYRDAEELRHPMNGALAEWAAQPGG